MDGESINPVLEQAPLAGQLVMVLVVIVGLALWLLGRRLARPAGALSGLVIGGFVALVASQALGDRAKLLIWVIIGCVVGTVMAWLLFRVWMSITMAVLMALALPAAVIYWTARTGPAPAEPAEAPTAAVELPIQSHSDALNRLQAQLADRYELHRRQALDWWTSQSPARRQVLAAAASVGALLGLVLGVAAPYVSASLASALVGGAMVMAACWQFLVSVNSLPPWTPMHPAVHLLALGLITALGVLIQWTIFRSAADK